MSPPPPPPLSNQKISNTHDDVRRDSVIQKYLHPPPFQKVPRKNPSMIMSILTQQNNGGLAGGCEQGQLVSSLFSCAFVHIDSCYTINPQGTFPQ